MANHNGNIASVPKTFRGFLWQHCKDSPMTIIPLFIIIGIAIARIFVESLTINDILSMVTFGALGIQFLGIQRYKRKRQNEHWEFDQEQLPKMLELNKASSVLGRESATRFLVPFAPKSRIRRWWYGRRKLHLLSLYSFGEGRSDSFTKYVISEKDYFFLKLKDCLDTNNPELLAEGMEFLKDRPRISTLA